MKLTIDIDISPRLRRNLDSRNLLALPMRRLFADIGEHTANTADELAPQGVTKQLSHSHDYTIDGSRMPEWVEIRPQAEHAIFVHEGTRPHTPPLEAIRPWAEAKGINPYALQQHIRRFGTRAQPWLDATVRAVAPYVARRAKQLGQAITRRWNA